MTAIIIATPNDMLCAVERHAWSDRLLSDARGDPQGYKDALRLHYFYERDPRFFGDGREREWGGYQRARERMRTFWSAYEQINRDYLPDDPVYSVEVSGSALSTTNDAFTFIAGSAAQLRVLEIILGGEATSSAVNRNRYQRSTSGTTGGGAITPEKFNTRSPAAATVVDTTWTGQPTLSANPWLVVAFNAFGGYVDWKAAPGSETYFVNSEQHSVRSASGTSTVSQTIVFEEL